GREGGHLQQEHRLLRSTFCAIISQLTEETQPLFETTIKSRSVSEDSDAKFTCIVTGYPQPEVTWYKDDEEMDRYCGLPKYEIFRHGNHHTLQLYKCREEDAGIYQASARNNKGIVSCSGVLEVGTMTEFKIHQKWFAKIKRKAEEKLREIEQGKKRGKENVEVEKLQGMSPDRLQRKRRLARDLNLRLGASPWEKEDAAKVHVADSQSRLQKDVAEPKEQPVNVMTGFPNKLIAPLKADVTTNGDTSLESVEENGSSFLAYIYETVEDLATKPMAKDSAAKKKKVVAPPAAKQEVSKREETGKDRPNPSPNPRFVPPVPLRRSARLRVANDQEVENNQKIKQPGKAVNQDTKVNGNMHFSLKEMYFDKEEKPAAGKEEAGAKEEVAGEAALQPVAAGRRTEDALSSSEVSEAGSVPSKGQRGQQQAQKLAGNKAIGPEVTRTESSQRRGCNKKVFVLHSCVVPQDLLPRFRRCPLAKAPRKKGFLNFVPQHRVLAAPSGAFEGGGEVQPQVPLVLPSPERPQEMSLEEKVQHKNLVSSLKNYLLLLLKMSDSSKGAMKEDTDPRDEEQPDAEEIMVPEIGIAGLSPRTSRRVLEKVQNNQLFQTAENLPLTPRTSRRITGMINEEFVTSKEMLACRPVPPKRRTRVAPEAEGSPQLSVPSIVVGSILPAAGTEQPPDNISDLPPASPEKESPGDPLAVLPCATPEELASGARRKIYLPKTKQVGEEEKEISESSGHMRSPTVSPRQSRKNTALLQSPALAPSPPTEQRSPTLTRKMATLEVPKLYEEPIGDTLGQAGLSLELQPARVSHIPSLFTLSLAPQVIRKIRAEQFSDASGNLKLWCQFFNILSDSKLMWYKDEIPVAEAQRSAGDEGQAALALVQASQKDCGVYRCMISNEYGTDSTDFLLSPEVLSGFILREEIEVGEEIEMTPMVFAKGLADAGYWGDKLFGRVISEDVEVGAGFLRKACRARAIYGLEPIFESGCTCVIKVHNFIVFGTKNENSLIEKNYDITIQECKIQNSSREYCKIFAAEARAVPDFGAVPEIIPVYLIYRPANNIPYATMEEDLGGPCEQYCVTERDGSLMARGTSEIVLKCCTFQHWVYQWTNGNILVTDMEGVGWKLTNVRIATNLKGYQGLKESCFPSLLEQFVAAHQCNRYCSILGLKTLEPAKPKGSRSPSMGRKSAQSSPQLQKKGLASPQGTRKAAVSPKSSRKAAETGEALTASKPGSGESGRSGCPQ
uniref:non-specific serine/threonine protein kinase n=1 Tax=Athene cunicularia TaxID=194338 RepID=A0A663M3W7_ATHCN